MSGVKFAVVTPRYGANVVGGAETAARAYARRLVGRVESVEVLTTTALSAKRWSNHFPAGIDDDDGVTVRRFHVTGERFADFDRWGAPLLARARSLDADTCREWIERQGPVAPGLIDALATTDADVIAFHPYLYHPTVAGLPLVAERAILHGAAHDEVPLSLPIIADLYRHSGALAYWTATERELVLSRFRVAGTPQIVLGLGVDAGEGDPSQAREQLGVGDRPFLLCLGRVNEGKGTEVLARAFAAYKKRNPGPLQLVFVGPVDSQPSMHPDIRVVGAVDEEVKWGALRAALALVSPSRLESFAIVLMEAWSVGTPVLVNAACAVTSDQVRAARGGLAFDSYGEFEAELQRLVNDVAVARKLGSNGARYVAEHYQWPDLVSRYVAFIHGVARRASR